MFYGFDLDGTVICSEHRKATLPDGTLDLAHWIENNKPEKIWADSLLPLVDMMRRVYNDRHHVIVVTARVLGEADMGFFRENNIPFHTMLDRPMGCDMADHTLKDVQLRIFANSMGFSWQQFCSEFRYFDDADSVLQHLSDIGVNCEDAKNINRLLRAI